MATEALRETIENSTDTLALLRSRMRSSLRKNPGLGSDEGYGVPWAGLFGNPEDPEEELDFLPAPDLEEIAAGLIAGGEELGHLRSYSISYLWKREGGEKAGQPVLGKCTKASGMVKHFSQVTWVVWLAADHATGLRRREVEAALYHELLHAEEAEDKEGNTKAKIAGHDVECFLAEIRRYGAWREALKLNRNAWQQAALPGV